MPGQRLRAIDILIVDKTGTLTAGKPAFDRAVPVEGVEANEVLRLAASLDQGSEHPLADAIVAAARGLGLALDKPETFEADSGIGVRGKVAGYDLALGLRVRLQRAWCAAGRRHAVSLHRLVALSDVRRIGHEPELGFRSRQRAAAACDRGISSPESELKVA